MNYLFDTEVNSSLNILDKISRKISCFLVRSYEVNVALNSVGTSRDNNKTYSQIFMRRLCVGFLKIPSLISLHFLTTHFWDVLIFQGCVLGNIL